MAAVVVAPLLSPLWDLPFLNLLKDSLSDFLKDFRRDIGPSPDPDISNTHLLLIRLNTI